MKKIKPMLATLVGQPFDSKDWLFEIKWDGFRALADVAGNKVELYSRNLLSFNDRFALIVKSLQKKKLRALLDGEVVVLDSKGKSRFELLQNYLLDPEGKNLVYYVFDILFLNGNDLRDLPLLERKKILKKVLPKSKHIRLSEHIFERGIQFYKAAEKHDLEGIIAKDAKSPYRSGKRTLEWQKIKTHKEQEAVIVGFTKPKGSRKKIGAVVLGVYEKGKLVYIGHVGGGFNEKLIDLVYSKLKPLAQKKSAFEDVPKTNTPVTWVKPKIVCEVKFEEWTLDGHMRQPIFLGLRNDKSAKQVHRELPK